MKQLHWQIIAGALIFLLFGIPIYIFFAQHWTLISDIFLVLFLSGSVYLIGIMGLSLRGRFINQDLIYPREGRLPAQRHRDGRVRVIVDDARIAEHLTISYSQRAALSSPTEEKIEAPKEALPKAPSFDEITHLIRPGDKVLLGYNLAGPVWVNFIHLCSTVVLGKSRRGKTTFLMFILAQIIKKRGFVFIWDGQGALTRTLRRVLKNCAYDGPTIKQSVERIRGIIAERLAQWLDDETATFPPIIIVADEWELVVKLCHDVIELAADITKHAAKVNVHVVFSNQNLPADLIAGSKNRGVIVSRVILYCEQEVASDVGLKSSKSKGLLDRLEFAPPGLAIIGTADLTWQIIAIPYTTHEHLRQVVEEMGEVPLPAANLLPLSMSIDKSLAEANLLELPYPPPFLQHDAIELESALSDRREGGEGRRLKVTRSDQAEILQLWNNGKGLAPWRIPRAMGKASEFYYVVRAVIYHEKRRQEASVVEE